MKLAVLFTIAGFAIGMSAFSFHPEWLEDARPWEMLQLAIPSSSAEADAALDPATAYAKVQQELLSYVQSQLPGGTQDTPEQKSQIEAYLGRLEGLRGQLEDSSTQRPQLHALFAAAKLCPSDYRARFEELAQRAVSTATNEDAAAEVRVLEFLIRHPLQSGITQEVLDDLHHFARRHPQSPWGISLFSAVASELWQARHSESAERVLTLGLQLYPAHPGRGALVRQLVDQGHRPAPKSQVSQAQWEAMERAIDRGQATEWSPSS